MNLKRLIVLGAGAIGGSIGGLLAHSGKNVVLVARGEHGKTIQKQGISIRCPDVSLTISCPCHLSIEDVEFQDGDAILLATKLQDAEQALQQLVNCIPNRNVPVICATNGIHAEKWASNHFSTVISMLVWMPATFLQPGSVTLYSKGSLGVLDYGVIRSDPKMAEMPELANWLSQAGFDAIERPNISEWKHAKWITNLGSAAQAMVEGDDWLTIARMCQEEGTRILRKAGLLNVTVEQLLDRCKTVSMGQVDGQDRQGGSTWQSFQRSQPLESPWLEGAIVDLADQIGELANANRFFAKLATNPRRISAAEFHDAMKLT